MPHQTMIDILGVWSPTRTFDVLSPQMAFARSIFGVKEVLAGDPTGGLHR
jgi:hypothetical protein